MTEIFKYFFTYRPPVGLGFGLFSTGHIVWIAGIILAAVILVQKYISLPRRGRRRLEKIICWTVFSLDMVRFVCQYAYDGFTPDLLPLHLCGMAAYISLWNVLRPGKIKREIIYSLCMPGAAIAVIFPAWTFYPMLNVFCIFCFITHALLVIYPLMLFLGGDLIPEWRNLPKCLLFIVAVQPPVYIVNRAFGTNFMFTNGTLGVFPLTLFEKWFGNPGYIFGMLILLIIMWTLLYLPLTLIRSKKKHEPVLSAK